MQMSKKVFHDPQHWLDRAEEARSIATQIIDPISRRAMLQIAENYDSLARRAMQRLSESQGSRDIQRHEHSAQPSGSPDS